mmetsp:Transcript_3148/g.4507  ORF Transcript_3148/g.4507 Transcript_3148/m.4507 type:complete len:114 (+) Transcript_3148:1268-1609(+)
MRLRTQHKAEIKRVKSDVAEYKGMKPLLKDLGMIWDPCAPYTLASNGIAQRMVLTVTERLRAVIFDSGLPEDFWPEALPSVVKGINTYATEIHVDRARKEGQVADSERHWDSH